MKILTRSEKAIEIVKLESNYNKNKYNCLPSKIIRLFKVCEANKTIKMDDTKMIDFIKTFLIKFRKQEWKEL